MKSFSPNKVMFYIILAVAYLLTSFVIMRIIGPWLISAPDTSYVVAGFAVLIIWFLITVWNILTIVAHCLRRKNQKEVQQ